MTTHCLPCASNFQKDDVLKVFRVEWGHIFAWLHRKNEGGPQFPCCIGCGQPYHLVRDQQKEEVTP